MNCRNVKIDPERTFDESRSSSLRAGRGQLRLGRQATPLIELSFDPRKGSSVEHVIELIGSIAACWSLRYRPISKPSGSCKRCRPSACIRLPFWHRLQCTRIVSDRWRTASRGTLRCRTRECSHTRKRQRRFHTWLLAAPMRAMMEYKCKGSGEQPAPHLPSEGSSTIPRSVRFHLPVTPAHKPIPAPATPGSGRSRPAQSWPEEGG